MLRARGSWRAKLRPEEPEATGQPDLRGLKLTAAERRVWRWIVPRLIAQGTAAEIDSPMLAALCRYVAVWRAATERAAEEIPGTLPYIRCHGTAFQAMGHLEKLSQRFGLTPADRAGLHAAPPAEQSEPEKPTKNRFFPKTG